MSPHAAHKSHGSVHRRSVALFGGTFDPVHCRPHRGGAGAQKRFHLDAVYFVPSSRPPHKAKPALTPFLHRYTMVALACFESAGFPSLPRRSAIRWRRSACFLHLRHGPPLSPRTSRRSALLHRRRRPVSGNSHLEKLRSPARHLRFHHRQPPRLSARGSRLVIPPEKLGRAKSDDPNKIVLRKSTIHLLTTVSSHISSTEIRHAPGPRPIHTRACARARGGLHSGTGSLPVTLNSLDPEIRWAVEAAQEKQALDVSVLNLSGSGAFADYFLLCSGSSPPQIQAIGEAIEEKLHRHGRRVRASRRPRQRGMGAARLWISLSSTFSANAPASITILSASGATPNASIFTSLPAVTSAARPKSHDERPNESEGNATQQ